MLKVYFWSIKVSKLSDSTVLVLLTTIFIYRYSHASDVGALSRFDRLAPEEVRQRPLEQLLVGDRRPPVLHPGPDGHEPRVVVVLRDVLDELDEAVQVPVLRRRRIERSWRRDRLVLVVAIALKSLGSTNVTIVLVDVVVLREKVKRVRTSAQPTTSRYDGETENPIGALVLPS